MGNTAINQEKQEQQKKSLKSTVKIGKSLSILVVYYTLHLMTFG